MAFAGMTDRQIINEIQYHLLETPNDGASYGSALYTAAEVQARLMYRYYEFAKQTGYLVKRSTSISTTANQPYVDVPSDSIDIIRIAYPNSSGTITVIPCGSTMEAQTYVADLVGSNSAVDVPYLYTKDVGISADISRITLWPRPNASRTVDIIYIAKPTALASTPDGTALDIPKDFCPFLKYGALSDLFNKSGETYDPQRAALTEEFYNLGIQVARAYVSGSPSVETIQRATIGGRR
jgi:hypothetical protein